MSTIGRCIDYLVAACDAHPQKPADVQVSDGYPLNNNGTLLVIGQTDPDADALNDRPSSGSARWAAIGAKASAEDYIIYGYASCYSGTTSLSVVRASAEAALRIVKLVIYADPDLQQTGTTGPLVKALIASFTEGQLVQDVDGDGRIATYRFGIRIETRLGAP